MKHKAQEFREKFGNSSGDTSEVARIYAEINKVGDICKNIHWHEEISYATKKELKKEGLHIEFDNGCYVISW